jgi:hypothetical protein
MRERESLSLSPLSIPVTPTVRDLFQVRMTIRRQRTKLGTSAVTHRRFVLEKVGGKNPRRLVRIAGVA